jgi:N-methylhydantoinase B
MFVDIAGNGADRSDEVDPISVAVARASLNAVAQDVFALFERTALLPLLYEVHDFGVSIFDERLNLIADAPGVPEFVGSLDFALASIIDQLQEKAPLAPDDVIITTHPFLTGNHPPDASMVAPAFADGRLVGYCGLKAHMGDVGAKDTYPVDSRSIYEEGLLLPPLKLYSEGRLNTDIAAVIEANSRLPRETVGNVLAGAAAISMGARKLAAIVKRFGMTVYREAVDQLLDQGEREVRAVIAALPDGIYRASDWMDDNGITPGQVALRCTVTVSGSDITVDTTGSAPEQEGAYNSTLPMTMAACRLAMKRLTTQDTLPANTGEHRPLTVIAPEGSVFNPRPPAATFEMALTAQRLGDMIHEALAPVSGGRIPSGTSGDATIISGTMVRESGELTFMDGLAPIGYGATATSDGMSALFHFPLAGLKLASAETTEIRAPAVLLRAELCQDSGGPGRMRGGLGTRLQYRSLGSGSVTLFAERLTNPIPEGQEGGHPPSLRNLVIVNPGTDREVVAGKLGGFPIVDGDVIVLQGGSGAGYGDPCERHPEAVLEDVIQGYVSRDAAWASYGVWIDPDTLAIDYARTAQRRGREATADSASGRGDGAVDPPAGFTTSAPPGS